MKQLFIGLMALNLCYLLIQQMSGADEVAPVAATATPEVVPSAKNPVLSATPVPTIEASMVASLLPAGPIEPDLAAPTKRRVVPSGKKASLEVAADEDEPAPASSASTDSCVIAGPYRERNQAKELVDDLANAGIDAALQPRDASLLPDYMVYVGPKANEGEARALDASFKARKMDSHIIAAGALLNALSLGVFSREPLAKSLRQRLEDDGYRARISTITRNRHGYQVLTRLPLPLRQKLVEADTPMIDCPGEIAQR